jgi:hypothetical protein
MLKFSASSLANSVLPVPVGPKNKKLLKQTMLKAMFAKRKKI